MLDFELTSAVILCDSMKILSWNTWGLGDYLEILSLKKFLQHRCPDLVLLQESNVGIFYSKIIKFMWSYEVALYVPVFNA